jgi:hypothetical protein
VEQKEFRARLERGITGVTEDTEGYTFHYAAEIMAAAVITWVENERKCCPLLRLTLDMPEDGGAAARLGVPGVKAFVAAEMNVITERPDYLPSVVFSQASCRPAHVRRGT